MDHTSTREGLCDDLVGIAEAVAGYEVTGPPRPTRPVPAWVPAPIHLEIVPAGALVGGFVGRVPTRDTDITRLYAPIGLPIEPASHPATRARRHRPAVLDLAATSVAAMAAAVASRLG
jgi:hypothetical protein